MDQPGHNQNIGTRTEFLNSRGLVTLSETDRNTLQKFRNGYCKIMLASSSGIGGWLVGAAAAGPRGVKNFVAIILILPIGVAAAKEWARLSGGPPAAGIDLRLVSTPRVVNRAAESCSGVIPSPTIEE